MTATMLNAHALTKTVAQNAGKLHLIGKHGDEEKQTFLVE